MSDFVINLSNFTETATLLSSALPMYKIMNGIGLEMVEQIDRRFETGKGPEGKSWPKSWRVTMNQGGRTLVNKGEYRDSYNYRASENEAEIGSSYKWVNTHHYGAVIKAKDSPYLTFKMPDGSWVRTKKVNIPARPALGFDDQSKRLIKDVVKDAAQQYWSGLP